jgi:hypothetical protein
MHNSQDKYIISEFYGFETDKNVIKEAIEKNSTISITCILQKSNTLNRNGRVYPSNILKREVAKYMELVKERSAMGECDHPDSAVISLANVSHLVTEMWWEGETLYGKIEIADTPSGNIVKGLLRSGIKLGISSRGVGSVKSSNEKDVVQEDFELIAFDIVSSPSTPGAYLFKEGRQWGMKKLTSETLDPIKQEDLSTFHKEKYKGIIQLSEDKFWENY